MVVELQALIGKRYRYNVNGLTFHIRIIDARIAYGQIQASITPASDGSGARWVNFASLGTEVTVY